MRVNIITMGGKGKRFSDAGYKLPKPLIDVSGKPMVINVIRCLPKAEKWIFIVRKEYIDKFNIENMIKTEIESPVIIPLEGDTEGQAETCMKAREYVNPMDSVLVSTCDSGYLYDGGQFESLVDTGVDCIVWTFTKTEILKSRPYDWGWCELNRDGETIKDVSVKKPISDNPYNDNAIVAVFYFRQASDLFSAITLMMGQKVEGEFYMDNIPLLFKEMGKCSVIFNVDLYVEFGTTAGLYNYNLIEYHCRYGSYDDVLWKKYFNSI